MAFASLTSESATAVVKGNENGDPCRDRKIPNLAHLRPVVKISLFCSFPMCSTLKRLFSYILSQVTSLFKTITPLNLGAHHFIEHNHRKTFFPSHIDITYKILSAREE